MSTPMTTREERFRAWRKAGFGSDEAWRRADMPDVEPPRIYPDIIGAWREGEASYPHGPEQPPAWWSHGSRRAYLDGRWHACWTSEARERANAR